MKQPLASKPIGPHESSQQGRIVEVPSVNSPQDRPDELLKVYPRQITTGTQRGVQTVGYGRDKLDAPNNQISASGLNNSETTVDISGSAAPSAGQVLLAVSSTSAEWASGQGSGDVSSNTSSSVNSEIALFSGTGGKTIKRATGTGVGHIASGVLSASNVVESEITLADNTTNDVSTTKHGFTPKAPNDSTKFLRGDATWAVPSGGGGSFTSGVNNARDMTTASGSLTIAHGLGKTPSFGIFDVYCLTSNTMNLFSHGTYNGTSQNCIAQGVDGTMGNIGYTDSQTNEVIYLQDNAGTKRQEATVAWDGTNLTFTFTKSGSPGSGGILLLWQVTG